MTGADRIAELEAERDHLLDSLRDLDAERAAGDVDEADYVTLRDDYTKRAADVLRRLAADQATPASPPPGPRWRRRLVAVVAVAVVAGLAGWWAARSSGERVAGQSMSGMDPRSDVAVALAEARSRLGTDPLGAITRYDAVLAAQPDNVEAMTYKGWVLYLTLSRNDQVDPTVREQAAGDARELLQQAVDTDPNYPDPHCFRAIMAAGADDDATARAEGQTCLDLGPPAEARGMIEAFLARLGASTVPSTTG